MKLRSLLLVAGLWLGTSGSPAVTVRHTAQLRVGAQVVQVSFSDFPVRAKRSLDFIFAPASGSIDALSGWYRFTAPDGRSDRSRPLPHYPRDRRFWGLDSHAFRSPGRWTFVLTIGADTATLPIDVGPAPAGPPAPLISALSLLPLAFLLAGTARWWRRVRPARQPDSRAW